MARISKQEAGGSNVLAFLDMIAYSELGPALLAATDDGYNVIVGSTPRKPVIFASYADHPRQLIKPPLIPVASTAAGRYQILARFFDAYRRQLGLSNFGPMNQDRIALQYFRECHAVADIAAGRFAIAAAKCCSRWASLPGAGYGQRENKLAELQAAYVKVGGVVV